MLKVVAAVIKKDDKYLVARRASHKQHAGKWEFPGGKVENGESHHEAMEREWIEELGVMVVIEEERFGRARNGVYEIYFYEVEIVQDEYQDGEPTSQEHVDVKYFRLDECDGIEMNRVNKTMLNKLTAKYS